jgi:uncharacterized protein
MSNPQLGQEVAQAAHAPPSPCISWCQMNPQTGWCEGCHRSIDEIARWSGMSNAQKQAVWDAINERAQSLMDAKPK